MAGPAMLRLPACGPAAVSASPDLSLRLASMRQSRSALRLWRRLRAVGQQDQSHVNPYHDPNLNIDSRIRVSGDPGPGREQLPGVPGLPHHDGLREFRSARSIFKALMEKNLPNKTHNYYYPPLLKSS